MKKSKFIAEQFNLPLKEKNNLQLAAEIAADLLDSRVVRCIMCCKVCTKDEGCVCDACYRVEDWQDNP